MKLNLNCKLAQLYLLETTLLAVLTIHWFLFEKDDFGIGLLEALLASVACTELDVTGEKNAGPPVPTRHGNCDWGPAANCGICAACAGCDKKRDCK